MLPSRTLRWTYSAAGMLLFLVGAVAGFLVGVSGVAVVWGIFSGVGWAGLMVGGALGWAIGWRPFAAAGLLAVALVAWRRTMAYRHPELRRYATGDDQS